MSTETPLYLVACVQTKRPTAQPAKDLYRSPWFRAARRYVEAQGADWCILSALWGLVEPGEVLDPYERTMADYDRAGRALWGARVLSALEHRAPAPRPIVLLAGQAYRKPLLGALGPRASVPMAGLGIGQQLAYLARWQVQCESALRF